MDKDEAMSEYSIMRDNFKAEIAELKKKLTEEQTQLLLHMALAEIAELREKGMQMAIEKLCNMAADELNGITEPNNSTESINAHRHMYEFANKLKKYKAILEKSDGS